MLWRASLAWQREMRKVLEPYDITVVQFVLLASAWWLNRIGMETNQRELAAHAGIDKMMTSQVVRRLESAELVRRTTSKRDPRALTVEVTPKGHEVLGGALAEVQANDEGFFGQLGHSEQGFRDDLKTLGAPGLRGS